jgi:S-sulfo-L-cysteine synthase (O-acetyl-L-serine-dependent)
MPDLHGRDPSRRGRLRDAGAFADRTGTGDPMNACTPCDTAIPARASDAELLDDIAAVTAIGNTQLLPLRRLAAHVGLPETIELLLKAEWTNPGGSIKDRAALGIVRAAMAAGDLEPGRILLDATSGNTGIAYAMLGAAIGFPVELILSGSATEERKQTLAAYGANVTLSDPYDGSNGAIRAARERARNAEARYFYADQYNNPANPAAHNATTGPEIWSQTAGRVTHLVAGLGTTGTLMGAGRYLKSRNRAVQLIGVQPSESFHGIEGLKHLPTAIVPGIYDPSVPDIQAEVSTEEAFELARTTARVEGLFAGTSTGAALAAAIQVGKTLTARGEPGVLVTVAPDGGSRYLSSGLWA